MVRREKVEEQRLSFNLCQAILTKVLGMRRINKVCRWLLTVEQKEHHLFGVSDLLDYEEGDKISLETL